MRKGLLLTILVLVLISVCTWAQEEKAAKEEIEIKTDVDKISYVLGSQFARTLKTDEVEINREVFFRAMRDVFDDKPPMLTDEEMQKIMMDFRQEIMNKRVDAQRKEMARNLEKAESFLEDNAKEEGVKTTESGLQYMVIKDGTGESPSISDKVKVHYRGMLMDGTEFDNSYKRDEPAEFGLEGIIPGWTEALQLMKEGAKWKIFVPPALAYGEQGKPPRIPPNSLLIFELELLEVMEAEKE